MTRVVAVQLIVKTALWRSVQKAEQRTLEVSKTQSWLRIDPLAKTMVFQASTIENKRAIKVHKSLRTSNPKNIHKSINLRHRNRCTTVAIHQRFRLEVPRKFVEFFEKFVYLFMKTLNLCNQTLDIVITPWINCFIHCSVRRNVGN